MSGQDRRDNLVVDAMLLLLSNAHINMAVFGEKNGIGKGKKDLHADVENAADMADRPIKVVSE